MDGEQRRGKMRSFVIGCVLGVAGAIAAGRRQRQNTRRPRPTAAGLAAFESAPCYRETVARETSPSA